MIAYKQESQHTHTNSPQPYFVATYGRRIPLKLYDPEVGWQVVEWPDEDLGEQPDEATVLAWVPPSSEPPAPVTDVERVAAQSTQAFIEARRSATLFLDNLKGKVHAALIFSGEYDNAGATTQGVAFVQRHSARMNAFKDSGGHPDAASLLYDEIAASVDEFSWLDGEILAIFAAALNPQQSKGKK